jgi:hypothetical protein
MLRTCALASLLLVTLACTSGLPLVAGPTQDPSKWPPADKTLTTAIATMGGLKSLREQFSREIYRDEQFFLGVNVERAYVAPDRRYEKLEGRSGVEQAMAGETVYVGSHLFRRQGSGPWHDLGQMETFMWPSNEYQFFGVKGAAYEGPGTVDNRPARIVRFAHEGTVDTKDAGWQYETRLWLDPDTNYYLQRETHGTREEINMAERRSIMWRFAGQWRYQNHNSAISVVEPADAPAGPQP